jgi:hypothetical protein
MRVIALFCLATTLSVSSALGQAQAAEGGFASGGFGGPVVKFSQLLDEFAVFAGARGGWIANHSFVVGGGVYTLVNTVDSPGLFEPISKFIYGGFEVEYVAFWSEPVHFTIGTLVGAGRRFRTDEPDPDHDEVFVLEPAVGLEVNAARFLRIVTGFGYRYVSKETSGDLTNEDLRAFVASLTFKFGDF